MKGAAQAALFSFHFSAEPHPASRPRVTRWGGVYYGKNYTAFLAAAKAEAARHKGTPTDQPLAMMVEVVCSKPKTGKLKHPRGDTDNYVKGPLDALVQSEKFMKDDDQVVLLIAAKRYATPGEEPGVNVDWFPLEDCK